MILNFLQSKLKDIKHFQWNVTYYNIHGDVGPGSVLFAFPQILHTFCDLGYHCLLILFYQFYKIGTSLNIIESDQTLYDLTPGLGLQCSSSLTNCKPQERQRKCRNPPALIPVTEAKWFGIQISPGFSCLTWVKLFARDKSPPARTG